MHLAEQGRDSVAGAASASMQTRPGRCEASPLHVSPHGAIPAAADVFINAWCAADLCDVLPVVGGRVVLGLEVLLVQSAVELLSCDCCSNGPTQAAGASHSELHLRKKFPFLLVRAIHATQKEVIGELFPMARQQSRSSISPASRLDNTAQAS